MKLLNGALFESAGEGMINFVFSRMMFFVLGAALTVFEKAVRGE